MMWEVDVQPSTSPQPTYPSRPPPPRVLPRNPTFHRFFSSPAGSGFIGHDNHATVEDADDDQEIQHDINSNVNSNAHTNTIDVTSVDHDDLMLSVTMEDVQALESFAGYPDLASNHLGDPQHINHITHDEGHHGVDEHGESYEPNAHHHHLHQLETDHNILHQHRENHHHLIRSSSPQTTPLDAYLFGIQSANGDVAELDAITQLQTEHDAYIAILESSHAQEMQALNKQIEELKISCVNSQKDQNLQREVENSLAAIRTELEAQIRAEVAEERKKELKEAEEQFKIAMSREVEKIAEAVREEAKVQLQAQVQSMRGQVEAQVRDELKTETERKVRLALVQQMRPQVRAELENALRLEIRTAYSQEIRKEVEAALIPELEKRIASEYKAKHAKAQSAQKEHADAALQAQLAAAKKDLEERMRRDAEAKVARKVAKQVESEVRTRVEKMRQEVRAECEAEARKHLESSLSQMKQEKAEIARLRAVENVRRTREDAAHKEAEAEFQKKVAEFRRHVQEEEARIARMKAVVHWRDEHSSRRPASSLAASPSPNRFSSPSQPSAPHQVGPSLPTTNYGQSEPNTTSPMVSTTIPSITASSGALHATSPPLLRANHTPPNLNARSTSPNPISGYGSKPIALASASPTPNRISSPLPSSVSKATANASPPISNTNSSQIINTNSISNPVSLPTSKSKLDFNPIPNRDTPSPPKSPTKPPGVAFDFTFDVKLIAAKLISDAREYTLDSLTPQQKSPIETNTTTSIKPISTPPQNAIPTKPQRSPSPSPATPSSGYSLAQISTEQRAQKEFENQPPIVPPPGALGARLRVLLPRLYQLWDESEISHVHRLDFTNSLRSMDVAPAERRVAMEIANLRRTFPAIQKEMALVTRREAIKARLAQDDAATATSSASRLSPADRTALLAELRRLTSTVQPAIQAWEQANGTPFMYRGFPYRALLHHSSSTYFPSSALPTSPL